MNLVFEGGGIKGLSYVGALRYLESRGSRIENAAGTSIGAIIASLVVSGYRSDELERIIAGLDVDVMWPKSKKNKVSSAVELIKNKAIYSIRPMEVLLRNLLSKKGVRTFKDLKVGNNYKLKVIVTSLDLKKMIVLPEGIREFGINPDSLDVASAVCMSASLPLVYPPYHYKGFRFVDGGLLENFPIWVFDKNVFGFRVNKSLGMGGPIKRMLRHQEKRQGNGKIILIDTSGFRATDFRKGMRERYVLFNRGYYYTKLFFDETPWELP